MPSLTEQLTTVVEKTERLIALCTALQQENNALRYENELLNQSLESSKNQSSEIQERMRAVKLAKVLGDTDEKSLDIKQKINEFVREIDKCIVLLKK